MWHVYAGKRKLPGEFTNYKVALNFAGYAAKKNKLVYLYEINPGSKYPTTKAKWVEGKRVA